MKKLLLLPLLFIVLFPSYANAASTEGRIVGGTPTTTSEWPHTVSLVFRKNGRTPIRSAYWGHYCTGTLLTRQIVLTARHCYVSDANTDVVIGRSDLTKHGQGERIPVMWSEIVNNNDLNGDGRHDHAGDLALWKLVRPSKKGKPLGLNRLASPGPGDVRVAGWGLTETERPRQLRTVTIPRLPDSMCQSFYSDTSDPLHFLPGFQICAGKPGQDACMGDSGGPVMQKGKLVGVVSFGPYYCGQDAPGVYVRVDRVKRWIKGTLRWFKTLNKYQGRKPIKERAGWQPKKYVAWQITNAFNTCEESNRCRSTTQEVVIRANRYIRNATITIEGSNLLCPGRLSHYWIPSPPAQPDQRCSSSHQMTASPGGEEVSWEGWNSDYTDECPRITLRATIGGQPFEKSYLSCQAPWLVQRSAS